jgi:hypothetical protein
MLNCVGKATFDQMPIDQELVHHVDNSIISIKVDCILRVHNIGRMAFGKMTIRKTTSLKDIHKNDIQWNDNRQIDIHENDIQWDGIHLNSIQQNDICLSE